MGNNLRIHKPQLTVHGHKIEPDKQVVEVRDTTGALLCTITQGDRPNTIRVISKHDLIGNYHFDSLRPLYNYLRYSSD